MRKAGSVPVIPNAAALRVFGLKLRVCIIKKGVRWIQLLLGEKSLWRSRTRERSSLRLCAFTAFWDKYTQAAAPAQRRRSRTHTHKNRLLQIQIHHSHLSPSSEPRCRLLVVPVLRWRCRKAAWTAWCFHPGRRQRVQVRRHTCSF